MDEKVEKIDRLDKSVPKDNSNLIEEDLDRMPPNREHFNNLVNTANSSPIKVQVPEKIEAVTKNSLMDEVRYMNQRVDRFSKFNPTDLVAKADDVVNQMNKIKEKLATPNLQLSPDTTTLLNNKLQHIDENLRVALSKAGVEYNPSAALENKSANPIEKFLGFLTHAQSQLATLSSDVSAMALNSTEISPANMLRVQIKMGYISQETEFFTAVLNKALDSTKTIMNVQI